MYVYGRLGWSLPHGATAWRAAAGGLARHLEVGDLVFYGGSGYYSHVGIYAGSAHHRRAAHGAVVSSRPSAARRPRGGSSAPDEGTPRPTAV